MAFRSPLRNFVRFGSTLQTAYVDSLRFGTCASERPFALLKRLPASGPPFQGQSSWPIPSAQRPDLTVLVRSLRSSTLSGLPLIARIHRVRPVARFLLSFLDCSSTLHSRSGPFGPLPIKAFKLTTSREAHRIKTPDLFRSPLPAVFKRPATDQCSRFVTFRSAYCLTNLLEPSSLCSQSSFPSMEN